MRDIRHTTGRMGNQLFQFAYIYSQMRKGDIPDFFVQDPKYFEEYREEIRELLKDGIGYLDQVGVHVRRGKNPLNPEEPAYSENPFYVNLGETDYYERAMDLFPKENFVIFSDDPEYCKGKFEGKNIQVMEKGDEVDDFNLLASCKSQIIANSSFSWWAAFLNPNPAKTVIAPKQWYSDGVERTKTPNSWKRI